MKWLLWLKIKSATQIPILDKAVSIRPCANALGKDLNPLVFPQLWGNNRADFVFLVEQPVKEKENSVLKLTLLYLKIDLVSCGRGVG